MGKCRFMRIMFKFICQANVTGSRQASYNSKFIIIIKQQECIMAYQKEKYTKNKMQFYVFFFFIDSVLLFRVILCE